MTTPFPIVDPDITTPTPSRFAQRMPSGMMFVGVDAFLFAVLGYLAYRQFRKARSDLRQPGGETAPVSVAGGGNSPSVYGSARVIEYIPGRHTMY